MRLYLPNLVLIFCGLSTGLRSYGDQYPVPPELRSKYRYLYEEKLRVLPDGTREFHRARLQKISGLNILSVRGDDFEMAYQHGRLLREEVRSGVVPQAAQMLTRAVRNAAGEGFLGRMGERFLRNGILEPMLENAIGNLEQSSGVMHSAWGLSEATNVSADIFVNAVFNPEALLVALGQNAPENRIFGGLFGFAPVATNPSACSAFAAWGEATESGEMIIGRNTDYGLNGYFDRYPTVIYFEPNDGQKFMSLTSAGAHNAGVFAMNESGIFIGVHTIPTFDVSNKGLPVFMIGELVLKRSANMQEALDNFKKVQPAAGWTYMIASTKERRVVSVELSHKGNSVRSVELPYHVQTNHYLQADMLKHFYAVNGATENDTRARYDRIDTLLQQSMGQLNLRSAMQILQDKIDPTSGQVRAVGHTVAVHTTMSSAVVLPERGVIYVANGSAPVSQNSYVQLPTVDRFDFNHKIAEPAVAIPNHQFASSHPELAKSEQFFIAAKMAYEYDNNHDEAARKLYEAIRLSPNEPVYLFNYAVMRMRGDAFDDADTALRRIISAQINPRDHWRYLAFYYRGAILAQNQQAEAALTSLNEVILGAEVVSDLRAAAEKLARRIRDGQFPRITSKQLSIMFQQGDMIEY